MDSLDGPVALVTGGGSGIGLAVCERLRHEGARVAALDVDEPSARTGAGPDGLALVADVARPEEVAAAVTRTLDAFGRIDVLVNNAGIGGGPDAGRCHETPVEIWDRVQSVNARGPFLCSRAVLPAMLEAGTGQIITIASINGLVVLPGRCAYTSSKGAAVMLTRSIAVDYGPQGIRANAICPGLVRTPLTRARLEDPEHPWNAADHIPLGRVAEPDEIADAVAVLAMGRLGYMNGAAWVIDGGWTAL